MIRRGLAVLFLSVSLLSPAAALERVTVGTIRHTDNGALFLAAAHGYFKDEGLDLDMTAYASDSDVAQALAGGAVDFGLAAFTPAAFNFAGRGMIKAIAGQVREKTGYEGNGILASNAAYVRGLRRPEQLTGLSVATGSLGSLYHYQFTQIARAKEFDAASLAFKPQPSLAAIANALAGDRVDAAIVPSSDTRDLLTTNRAKLVGWYSDLAEQQLGALFASVKLIQSHRVIVQKFLRAYRRGAADYYGALMRHDRYGKRVSNAKSHEVALIIARYVYPGRRGGADKVEAEAYFMDADARLDVADITRQVEWYKAQGVIDPGTDARTVMDLSFK